MAKKLKAKKENEDKFNVDNEIIIGIKTLPTVEKQKTKRKKTKAKTKKNYNKKNKREVNTTKKTNSKTKKIKHKKLKLIKKFTIAIILFGALIYFLLSPYFNIKNIEVHGTSVLTQEEIVSLSQIKLDENTFKIIKNKIEKNIKQNAYVENVKIKRKLPNTITIEIEERTPTFIISFANAYAYINNQGYFLEISKEKLDLPVITGFLTKEGEIQEGNRMCLEDLQRLDDVLQILKSAESNEINTLITKINISDKQNYILELKNENKTVNMGDTSNLSTKMLYIKSIIEQNKNIEGEILVNTDLSNKGAIFRKKV